MPFYNRDSVEIDVSTLLSLMRSSEYVYVERSVIVGSKGRIIISTQWTGQEGYLFETIVSNSPIDGYFKRSNSELEAMVVHWETVELVKDILSHDYSSNE